MRQITNLLTDKAIEFRKVHHQPTYSSKQSAKARGEDITIGGKAIVIKVGETFKLLVLSAALRLDSGKLRRHFGTKRIRFASTEELKELTGLEPGSVPPFGRPILDLDICVDNSICQNDRIAFNAGSLRDSIIM